MLTLSKQSSGNAQQTPSKKQGEGRGTANNPKLEDAYERKPSPINLKPLSPRTVKLNKKDGETADPSAAPQ